MQQIKMLFLGFACIALFFAGASTVSAQTLDDTWFKVNISAKGSAVDMDDGSVGDKIRLKGTGYLHLSWNGSGYNYVIVSQSGPDTWERMSGSFPLYTATEDTVFMAPAGWAVYFPDGTAIGFMISGQFKVKLNKSDNLKSATFKSLGVIATELLDPVYELPFIKTKVKVKMIDEDKLPAGVSLP